MAKVNVKIANSTRCNGDYSLYVTFDFDMRIVEVIRSFSTKFWNAEDKIWELPLNKLTELTTKIDWCEFNITADKYVTLDKPEVKVPDNFKFKTNPYDHQIVGFNYGLQNDRWLLGDEMGLGKTKQVIDIAVAKKLIKGYKHCFIVCGVNGLKWNWRNEVYTHSNESAYILGQKVKGNKISIGSNKDKLNDVKNLANIDSYFIITNVETLRDETINEELQKLCKDGTIGMIAFDECHKCFDYDTLVKTDLGELKIGDIVENKINCDVLSYNEITKTFEYKSIVNFWKNNTSNSKFIELTFEDDDGNEKKIKCTDDHLFLTKNRGWVMAKDLTEYDDFDL